MHKYSMRVKDVIQKYNIVDLDLIKNYCSQFLEESDGLPIIKNLPQTYENFQKVKVRKRKGSNTFSNTFNVAFEDELNDLRERAVFASSTVPVEESADPFYIFPINGYNFLYSKEVENSTENYKQVFESIFDQFDENNAKEIFTDLLKFTYVSENLAAGIESGAEIIVYGIPYYYVIRKSYIDNYNELLTMLI